MTEENKYSFSFTAAPLILEESKAYISHIESPESYFFDDEEIDYMVLPTNSESSKKRLKLEIDKRLKNLSASYIEAFKTMNDTDRKLILFLAICKTYKIITEFCVEVIYQKWKMFDREISTYDFQYYIANKVSDEQLNELTELTQYKLSQVVIRILKDVGIVVDNKIEQPYLSDHVRKLIAEHNDEWFYYCILQPQK